MAADPQEYRFQRIEEAIARLTRDMESLDQNGSRQVQALARDVEYVAKAQVETDRQLRANNRQSFATAVSVIVALLVFVLTVLSTTVFQ
jgi:hypothetical protein